MTVDDRIDRALSDSRVRQRLGWLVSGSRIAAGLWSLTRDGVGRLQARGRTVRSWLERSRVRQLGHEVTRKLEALAGGSRALSAVSMVEDWVRLSWLYRWLTAEPEPDVVVIDLRETMTVRPFLTAIDDSLGLLVTGSRTSIVRQSMWRGWQRLRTSPVRYASLFALFVLLSLTAVSVVRGTLGATGFWLRCILVLALLAGTRVDQPWEEVRTSRPVQLLIAALEPPEPPGEDNYRDESTARGRRDKSSDPGHPDEGRRSPDEHSPTDGVSDSSSSGDDVSDSAS